MEFLVIALVLSLLWSLNPAAVSKWGRHAPPILFTAVRALFAFVFLLIALYVLTYTGFTASTNSITPLAATLIFLSALTGPAFGDTLYVKSIQLLGGSLAVTISYTYIMFTQLFAHVFGVEVVGLHTVVGGAVAFAGIMVAVLGNDIRRTNVKGIVCAIGAAVNWGMATVLIKAVRSYMDPVLLSITRLLMVFVIMLTLSAVLERDRLVVDKEFVIAALVTGILGWGLGMVLFVYSIYTVGASTTSIATALTPVLSQVVTRLIASEKPSLRVVAGAVLVALGIAVSSSKLL